MTTPYTFTVLRYVHDVVSGEFVNVGVALYAPRAKFLGAACTTTYGRVSHFFGGIESDHLKRLMRHVQAGIEELGDRLGSELPFEAPSADARGWAERVLPADDSSLQFSAASGGVTSDPAATLEQLYQRFVEQYARREERPTRSDEDVMRVFWEPLARRRLASRLRSSRIAGSDYEHEFPIAWKSRARPRRARPGGFLRSLALGTAARQNGVPRRVRCLQTANAVDNSSSSRGFSRSSFIPGGRCFRGAGWTERRWAGAAGAAEAAPPRESGRPH